MDRALAEHVDVVALSGDLVDRANRFYEATGPLETGIRRLAGAGIVTVAVAGNHDYDVLPWLVDGFDPDAFRLLGRGGEWERTTIRRGDAVLHVDGWSFAEARVERSPLGRYDLPGGGGAPVLGLLHADLDQPGSIYAPVTRAELRARPVDFWLLGHVHAPGLREEAGGAPVLYPGSPQAMDPGEAGAHGVWIVEVEPGRIFRARPLPLSSVRYDVVEVDVTGIADPLELDRRVADGLRAHLVAVAPAAGPLEYLCCRLRLAGRTPLHRGLEPRLAGLAEELALVEGGVTAVVEKVELDTRPAYDLAELARGSDPTAVLAGLLQALEQGQASGEHERLLREAARCAGDVRRARPYLALPGEGEEAADAEVAAQALARQASRLLDGLLAQKEGA